MVQLSTDDLIRLVLIVLVSFLSFVGTLSCIICYLIKKELHTLGCKVLMGLAVSNLILSFAQFLSISYFWFENPEVSSSYQTLCHTQAIIVNFSQLATILWVATLSWIMYRDIIIRKKAVVKSSKLYYFTTFSTAAAFTVG